VLKLSWPFRRKGVDSSLELFREIFGAQLARTGVSVTWETAIATATAAACIRSISNGVSQVPLKLFQESEDGASRTPARKHPLYRVLSLRPNPWQTSFEYRETVVMHLALTGRHYSFINRVRGRIVELIPFQPGQVEAKRDDQGEVTYKVTYAGGRSETFPAETIWHVRGASWDGWQGMDAIKLLREAVGLSIAAEDRHAKYFKNGVSSSGVYSVEGTLNPEQYKTLRKFIADNYSGESQGLPMILDRQAKWLPLSMSGVDAQHLETRRFQVEEVCRAIGVMPIMVGHADKTATYASAEQMFLAHVVHTLTPWYARLEQSMESQLLTEREVEEGYYPKFVAAGLLRGSTTARADYYSKALGSGGSPAWMTQDEVRGLEELNPMGGAASALPKPTNVAGPKPAPKPDTDTDDEGTQS
jgi:HK97 family phage portal protein